MKVERFVWVVLVIAALYVWFHLALWMGRLSVV